MKEIKPRPLGRALRSFLNEAAQESGGLFQISRRDARAILSALAWEREQGQQEGRREALEDANVLPCRKNCRLLFGSEAERNTHEEDCG